MINFSIIVVNWNSGTQLTDCIRSIKDYSRSILIETIVVDNASSDGSELIASQSSSVKLIRSNQNFGFGKACNLGAKSASGKYLLFLNPDAALYKDTLQKSLAFMEDPSNSDVGICGVQLIDDNGKVARTCARFPSVSGYMAFALGLDRVFPQLGHFMREWPHDQTHDVDQIMGAYFLVRRSLFESLGGFDERFFVYFEEVDFSLRARQAGWRSVYLSEAQAFHAGGGTSDQIKARRLFYSLRSRLLYVLKHFNFPSRLLVIISTLFIEPFSRSSLAVARCSWSTLSEICRGYGMLWRWLPRLIEMKSPH